MSFTVFKKSKIACALAALAIVGTANYAAAAPAHDKTVIGYITQWEAWKTMPNHGIEKGAATHLNVDMSKYSILNFSFFGVAKDGSLHSGDYRNKAIYKKDSVQEPAPLLHEDLYSSWDYHILWGELDMISDFPGEWGNKEVKARIAAQGFVPHPTANGKWLHEPTGLSGKMPIPLKKEGGTLGLLDKAEQEGVTVMASIGGWSMSKHFPEMAADPIKRERFLQDVKRLMDMGFDGIDLDWEYPGFGGMNFDGRPDDFKNFEDLVVEIRRVIGPDKKISAAFAASPAKLEGFDWPKLDQYMDYFNMMTYDYEGGWSEKAGHNSPLYAYPTASAQDFNWHSMAQFLAAKNVTSSKINMGLAYYGRGVQTSEPADVGAKTNKRQVTFTVDGPLQSAADLTNWKNYEGQPNYVYIKQKMAGWTEHWDDVAKVPYLTKGNYFLSYDNEKSVGLKAEYVVDNNLGGVIVWQVAGDLECKGSYVPRGRYLKECTNLSLPLATVVDNVFNNTTPSAAPVLTVPGAQTVDSGATIELLLSATDADTQKLRFSADMGTVVATSDKTATLSYTAPTSKVDQTLTVNIKVSDGKKIDSKAVVIKVIGDSTIENNAPTLTVPASVEVVAGNTVAINVSAADQDAADTLTITSNMGELTQSGNNAVINYTAEKVTADTTVSIEVIVSDGTDTVKQTVLVNVKPAPIGNEWDANKIYNTGDSVMVNGVKYTAKWWTKGEKPGTSAVWAEFDDGSTQEWRADKVYTGGKLVTLNGVTYKAKWWTKGNNPADGGPWAAQ
ncbi:hypothetical protein K6Y31_07420 [Motilimonas cestriensis]|uniref:chitinase n=1 Tax=Motilimonas cestriensis TaxID=2742685 RepID=A0ABS8W968_9GAMM|nr:glycosyl hydrolase family 18 protein [Motilimonas cestriensis]MCE2594642.1 hypothetical protein [Motilimonas cestriensis]